MPVVTAAVRLLIVVRFPHCPCPLREPGRARHRTRPSAARPRSERLLPPTEDPVAEARDPDHPAGVFRDDVCATARQLSNQLVDVPEGVRILNLTMQLPGNRTVLVADLEDNLGGGIGEGDRAEVLGLLRR